MKYFVKLLILSIMFIGITGFSTELADLKPNSADPTEVVVDLSSSDSFDFNSEINLQVDDDLEVEKDKDSKARFETLFKKADEAFNRQYDEALDEIYFKPLIEIENYHNKPLKRTSLPEYNFKDKISVKIATNKYLPDIRIS